RDIVSRRRASSFDIAFQVRRPIIRVPVLIGGPERSLRVVFALDTGASTTLIDQRVLRRLGYVPTPEAARVVTPSGLASVAGQVVGRLSALGTTRQMMPVLSIALPREAG